MAHFSFLIDIDFSPDANDVKKSIADAMGSLRPTGDVYIYFKVPQDKVIENIERLHAAGNTKVGIGKV